MQGEKIMQSKTEQLQKLARAKGMKSIIYQLRK